MGEGVRSHIVFHNQPVEVVIGNAALMDKISAFSQCPELRE